MAARDLIAAQILSNGWIIQLTFESMTTGGSYAPGYGANGEPDNAKGTLNLSRPGYNAAKTPISRSATSLLTFDVNTGAERKPYPDQADPQETVSGSDVIINVPLSKPIYSNDTGITLDLLAGYYTDGGGGNNESLGFSVTNNSTNTNPKVKAGRATFERQKVTGNYEVEIWAFHRSGIAAVELTVTDESLNSVTYTKNDLQLNSGNLYGTYSQIYKFDVDVSTLTDLEKLTHTFKVYPIEGDSNTILDSSDAVNVYPSMKYRDFDLLLDKGNNHGWTVVDPTSGNDGTGTVYSTQSAAEAGNAYQTHAAALTAIQSYNNTNAGHNDAGGGVILLTEDTHNINTGAGGGSTSTFCCAFKPVSTAIKTNVIVNIPASNSDFHYNTTFQGVTIQGTGFWAGYDLRTIYFDDCTINNTGSYLVYGYYAGGIQQCNGSTTNAIQQFGSNKMNYTTVYGNDFTNSNISYHYTVLGNYNVRIAESGAAGIELNDGGCYAFNVHLDNTITTPIYATAQNNNYSHGHACINNLMVRYGSKTEPAMYVSGDGTTTTTDGMIIWNNQIIGARQNLFYNDVPGNNPHTNASVKNNIFSNINNKDDTFANNATAIGSWMQGYHVEWENNHYRTSASDEWFGENYGLWFTKGTSATPLDPGYINDQSADGGDSSGGDYHLSEVNNCITAYTQQLPFDLEGNPRIVGGTIGVYETGSGVILPIFINNLRLQGAI